jgi:hypothetical protein
MAPRVLRKLTAVGVRALEIPGLYEDGGGLRLVVSQTCARRWVMRISIRGPIPWCLRVRRDIG